MQFEKRHGTISPFLVGFPVIVMVISIALAGNSLVGASSTNIICNPNQQSSCGSSSSNNTNAVITKTCSIGLNPFADPCTITTQTDPSGDCPANPPPPSYCGPTIPILHPTASWLLPQGDSVTILENQTSVSLANSASGVFFNLGSVGQSGFIAVIGIVMGIVCLAGITIFGSGEGAESVHILFMGGMMMGLWLFLSGLDGFASNDPGSVFTELNSLAANLGTDFYVLLTFMYLFGFAGMVKRGV